MKKAIFYTVLFLVAILVLTLGINWFIANFRDSQSRSYSPVPAFDPPIVADSTIELPNNQIRIFGTIDDYVAFQAMAMIESMEKDTSVQEIEILINSTGGGVTSTLLICYAMKFSKKPIKTIALDEALSGAAYILSSGTKYRRFAQSNSQIMIHRPASTTFGFIQWQSEDFEREARKLRQIEMIIYSLISENTGRAIEQTQKDIKNDLWMSYKQAIEYGLIDSVYQE